MNGENYLSSAIKEFRKLKDLGERAVKQIRDEDFFWQPDDESNSVAIIIRHISGNMHSRWTDFLSTDGEKEWRKRDEEFERIFYTDKDDILMRWESGWKRLFETLESLKSEDLGKTVTIRNEPHTVIEAINRQLTHIGYHIGQIAYIARHRAGDQWTSLSIPRKK
ncbi:MAG: DUF1572 domain-containing protein [Ignavibacteria bacterium]|nr:DUF1572 domain-containing protein [Ignavibacteria bacterium]